MDTVTSFALAAEPAARWWADRVRAVRAESDGLHPGLTNRQALAQTMGIALRAQAIDRARVDDGVIDGFAAELCRLIAAAVGGKLRLCVDYHPDGLLAEAAENAGLDQVLFPGKTRMIVHPDHILAKAGYSAPWGLLWSAPGWRHPACGIQDWPDDSGDPTGPECAHPRWHGGRHDWQQT